MKLIDVYVVVNKILQYEENGIKYYKDNKEVFYNEDEFLSYKRHCEKNSYTEFEREFYTGQLQQLTD